MYDLELRGVVKRFGGFTAVRGVSLQLERGKLLTLLGPSGCGKTTLLRIISGFLTPDEGEVFIGGKAVTHVPPHLRGTGMVYQNYALFPHMTVFDNVAFGLRMRRVPRAEAREKALAVLERVGLAGLEKRYPGQLSGGQQQRVALARALVIEPTVLLLDEPLSNLDAKLRLKVRGEIRELQRRLQITTVFVTHDQEEALALSDEIAVISAGQVEQRGSPRSIYESPATPFVMEFVGSVNRLPAQIVAVEGGRAAARVGEDLVVWVPARDLTPGEKVVVGIRPEKIGLASAPPVAEDGTNVLRGEILDSHYLGFTTRLGVRVGEHVLHVSRQNLRLDSQDFPAGSQAYLFWEVDSCLCFRKESQAGLPRGGEEEMR